MQSVIVGKEPGFFRRQSGKTWFLASTLVLLFLASTVYADELPPSAFVEGVIGHPQEHNLSCESRSATDLSAFWGVTFAEDDFFRRLPRSP